jgi:KaiC/GvpD/RAD55 family RecA-like ATPase
MPSTDYQIELSDTCSGNVTLDKLLRRSGFTLPHDNTCGLVVLLRGKPGTGKSTLALQILDGLKLKQGNEQEGEVVPLKKYYCSVEQTVTDLHFKWLSMLVAQAILPAWKPQYDDANPKSNKLICDVNTFWQKLPAILLRDITKESDLIESVDTLLGNLFIPLYAGPSDEHHVLPNEAREIAELLLKSLTKSCLQAITCACIEAVIARAQSGIAERRPLAEPLPDEIGQQIAKGFTKGSDLEKHVKWAFSKVTFSNDELTHLTELCKTMPNDQATRQVLGDSRVVQNMARLLFECKMTHGGYELRFRGLEGKSEALSPDEPFGAGRSRSLGALRMLDAIVEELQGNAPAAERDRASRPVIVIDGLSLLTNSEREMLEIEGIVDRLRQLSQIGIIVYEPNEDESVNLDHHADMVIELQRKELKDPMAYLIHEICLKKARYQETALGQHQFKIRRSGLVFFPSLHFQIQHPSHMDFEVIRSAQEPYKPEGIPDNEKADPKSECSVIDMIFPVQKSNKGKSDKGKSDKGKSDKGESDKGESDKGESDKGESDKGESIMLFGSRGTFKTELTLDFLARGSIGCPWHKEPRTLEKGLLVSLIDNSPSVEWGLWCPWREARYGFNRCTECKSDKGQKVLLRHARPFRQPPGCISSAEFVYYLEEVIGRLQPKGDKPARLSRLVFWDLTQLDHRFPLLKADHLLLPALIDIFKQKGLRSLFMGAENATHTQAASAMADNVLFCWRSRTSNPKEWESVPKSCAGLEGDWKYQETLMLYVDRAAASERPAASLYKIPIFSSKRSERLLLPENANAMNEIPFLVEWKKTSGPDLEHITKLRRLQGVQ